MSLEAQISQLRQDIQKYQVLSGKVSAVITKLNSAASNAGSLDLEVKSSFKVNGESALVSNRTTKLKKELDDTVNYLSGAVLPAIGTSVESANRQIAALEAEIERRRREAEEAARRAAAEAERKRQEEAAKAAAASTEGNK